MSDCNPVIQPNEGAQTVTSDAPVTFTYAIPAGYWAEFFIDVTAPSCSEDTTVRESITVYSDVTASGQDGVYRGTITAASSQITFGQPGPVVFAGNYSTASPTESTTPGRAFESHLSTPPVTATGMQQIYPLILPKDGGTVTLRVSLPPYDNHPYPNQRDLIYYFLPVLTLYSIGPGPPAGQFVLTHLDSGAIKVSLNPYAGYAPYKFLWGVGQNPRAAIDAVTVQNPGLGGDENSFTCSGEYPATGSPPGTTFVAVACKVTNTLLPCEEAMPPNFVNWFQYNGPDGESNPRRLYLDSPAFSVFYNYIIFLPAVSAVSAVSACLAQDASRRPLAATAGPQTAAFGFSSIDAGHTFIRSTIDVAATCADISLLVDTQVNRFCAVYSKGPAGSSAIFSASGPVTDALTPEASPAAVAGITGSYPACAQHPQNRSLYLMAYVSGAALKAATSGDGGKTWQPAGTIASGVDFSKSGRAAVCFLGETAFAVYASGSGVACAKSADWGQTWTAAGASIPDGPYTGLSLLGFRGTLYLLAFTASAAGADPAAATLLKSGDLGGAWAVSAGKLPAIALPSAIGVIPETGQLRLGMSHYSNDDGATWTAD